MIKKEDKAISIETYKEIKIENAVYKITSTFSNKKELNKIFERLITKYITSEMSEK